MLHDDCVAILGDDDPFLPSYSVVADYASWMVAEV